MTTTTAPPAYRYDQIYIDGGWIDAVDGTRQAVHSPSTEEQIGEIPVAGPADVDRAVRAAREAFPAWSQTPVDERTDVLRRIGSALYERVPQLTDEIVHDLGMPHQLCMLTQVAMAAETFMIAARLVEELPIEERYEQGWVRREPAGVVAAVTPWNFPLAEMANKTAFAMAVGCTVVIKPSDLTPLAAFELARIVDEVGAPAGVVNLVPGGGEAGIALVRHPGVDLVSFTGSDGAGRAVAELAARNVTRVRLELGGKSATVVLPDGDLAAAVPDGLFKAFLNSGQVCCSQSRLLVPRARLREAEELVVGTIEQAPVGDPFDPDTLLGPLVSAEQVTKVGGHIEDAIEDGARLITGGPGRPDGLTRGHYVRPTAFSDVTPDHRLARSEVFGPVLAVLPYDTEAEAIAIAEDTEYGLSAAIWSADQDHALEIGRRLRVGQVEVNGGVFDPLAPFGGFKRSGYGRSAGRFGLEDFVEIKSVLLPTT